MNNVNALLHHFILDGGHSIAPATHDWKLSVKFIFFTLGRWLSCKHASHVSLSLITRTHVKKKKILVGGCMLAISIQGRQWGGSDREALVLLNLANSASLKPVRDLSQIRRWMAPE